MANTRVTITLPDFILKEIDRQDSNRSRFILAALRAELERRRRELLDESLRNPHPESEEFAHLGSEEWPEVEAEDLLDRKAGVKVAWIPGEGWRERQ